MGRKDQMVEPQKENTYFPKLDLGGGNRILPLEA